jgi:hypothetical protein
MRLSIVIISPTIAITKLSILVVNTVGWSPPA